MALTIAEKALAAVLGIETARPGTTGTATRAAIRAGGRAILAGTLRIAPPVTRAVGRTAVANPALAAGILGTAAYQGGYLDPAIQRAQDESFRAQERLRQMYIEPAAQAGYNPIYGDVQDVIVKGGPKVAKRKLTKFNRAVKAGMKAVKDSRYSGPKGKVRNPKATMARISKVWKAKTAGRKVSTKGETGLISRNIKRYIG